MRACQLLKGMPARCVVWGSCGCSQQQLRGVVWSGRKLTQAGALHMSMLCCIAELCGWFAVYRTVCAESC